MYKILKPNCLSFDFVIPQREFCNSIKKRPKMVFQAYEFNNETLGNASLVEK